MESWILVAGALALTVGAVAYFMHLIGQVAIARRRPIVNALLAGGMALSIAAYVQGVGVLAGILAALPLLVGTAFFVLLALAGQSKQAPAVAVGGPLIDFTAADENGEPFDLSSLRGRPVLLKFFRGHW
jgi:hypothetical protein